MPINKENSSPKKKPATKPLADIARPGKTTPDTGSRPIIVSRKPVVDDPMVNKNANSDADPMTAPTTDSKPLKDLLKAGRKELVLNPTDKEALDKETVKPTPGDTINAGGEAAAAAEKTESETVDKIEDLPVDEKPILKSSVKKPSRIEPTAPAAVAEKPAAEPEAASVTQDNAADTEPVEETPADEPVDDSLEGDDDVAPEHGYIDEIVADDEKAKEAAEVKEATKPPVATKRKLVPTPQKDTSKTDAKATEKTETAAKATDEKSDASEGEHTTDSVVQEPEGGLVDELAKQTADKKQQAEQDKQMSVKQEKLMALVDQKAYFVKTSKLSKRRTRNVLIVFVLLLIVAVIGLNFALDAEVLDLGVQPVTNIL